MPVRGLRKYLSAASNLFDAKHSTATLLSIDIEQEGRITQELQRDQDKDPVRGFGAGGIIKVTWNIEGVLMLPWRPKVKPWTGWTKYHLDEEGLIEFHEEGWDISALRAFVETIWPELGDKIWVKSNELEPALKPISLLDGSASDFTKR
eukprot:CAMPEP_0204638998 /NCGR_PEP_ID=MMETSP0717-20131115/41355_1 /ASSEMBLY_ACC=CAM_ASM_000666 /TAXON_ID=230516 /ORGANISM="Chaetoceros curvisetus" /LENGTH=148 /DNA_ID=CAMNT_0051658937 /DNA_START=276 /DNA_END=722 /DNA_ORIENTATION=-